MLLFLKITEKKLAGKKAIFSLIIKDIQELVDSSNDDQLAKEVGEENLELLTKTARMLKILKLYLI